MTEKNGIVTFECDKDKNGNEILNSTQRNNEIVWPPKDKFPKAQYTTTWKNTCNCTSYGMALEYAGYIFPSGRYKQPEDNLAFHILNSKKIIAEYSTKQPAMYKLYVKSLEGKCTDAELKDVYPPTELHDYLCMGANDWLGTKAAQFSTNVNFKEALWKYMVSDNLPMVISTIFGGFNHIVCVTGVQYTKSDYEKGLAYEKSNGIPNISPVAIIVDDPWGKYNPKTNKYDAPNGGNDIVVPWDVVVTKVKPVGSSTIKWAHTFNHAVAIV